MPEDVFKELEELKRLLDEPQLPRASSPASPGVADETGGPSAPATHAVQHPPAQDYTAAITEAEVRSLDNLCEVELRYSVYGISAQLRSSAFGQCWGIAIKRIREASYFTHAPHLPVHTTF
jgi:hypothetical protein